jgi:hypothetical protein
MGQQDGSGLAGVLRLDPVHQLRRQWSDRLIVFSPEAGTAQSELAGERLG